MKVLLQLLDLQGKIGDARVRALKVVSATIEENMVPQEVDRFCSDVDDELAALTDEVTRALARVRDCPRQESLFDQPSKAEADAAAESALDANAAADARGDDLKRGVARELKRAGAKILRKAD